MGGDPRSPPFLGWEDGGGRPVPAGITGDGIAMSGRSSCEGLIGSFQSGSESCLRQESGCTGGFMDTQSHDLVDPVVIADAQMEDDHPGMMDGMIEGNDAVPLFLAGSDCMLTGDGINGDADHCSFNFGDGESSGKAPVFSFCHGTEANEDAGAVTGVPRRSSLLRKPGNPRVSNRPVDGNDKEKTLLNNIMKVDPPRKAWSKPVLVRLPARALDSGDVVRDDRVQLDAEDVVATSKRFEAALVGRCFGRRLNFERLNAELHRRWDA